MSLGNEFNTPANTWGSDIAQRLGGLFYFVYCSNQTFKATLKMLR